MWNRYYHSFLFFPPCPTRSLIGVQQKQDWFFVLFGFIRCSALWMKIRPTGRVWETRNGETRSLKLERLVLRTSFPFWDVVGPQPYQVCLLDPFPQTWTTYLEFNALNTRTVEAHISQETTVLWILFKRSTLDECSGISPPERLAIHGCQSRHFLIILNYF